MKLSRIEIENCRWCHDMNVDVRNHLVLVGPNEAGKSTVLRLLDALLSWSHGRLSNEFGPALFRDRAKPLRVFVTIGSLDSTACAAFADEIEFIRGVEPRLSLEMVVSIASDDPESVDISRCFVKQGVAPIRVVQRHLPGLRWTLLAASRSADRELGRARTGTMAALLGAIDLGDETAGFEQGVDKLNEYLAGSQVLSETRTGIADAFSEVFPRRVTADDLRLQLAGGNNPLQDLDLQIASPNGEHMSLLDQSDGLRSLSVLSLQLKVRDGATITAIDEPEVHLHPRSQARLGKLLATKPGQRLVASHAPAVVRAFQPSDVVAMTSKEIRQLPHGTVEADKKFFSQWWVESMVESLTATAVVLVEGYSDAVLVRRSAELKGLDLDHKGVCVVVLGGANNFANAYRLLGPKGFGLPVFSLVDEAEAGIPAKALGIPLDELVTNGVFTCLSDLEEVYVSAIGGPTLAAMLTGSGLFKANRLRQSHGVADLRDATSDQLLTLCRVEKVQAALAVAEGLRAAQAAGLGALDALTERLRNV